MTAGIERGEFHDETVFVRFLEGEVGPDKGVIFPGRQEATYADLQAFMTADLRVRLLYKRVGDAIGFSLDEVVAKRDLHAYLDGRHIADPISLVHRIASWEEVKAKSEYATPKAFAGEDEIGLVAGLVAAGSISLVYGAEILQQHAFALENLPIGSQISLSLRSESPSQWEKRTLRTVVGRLRKKDIGLELNIVYGEDKVSMAGPFDNIQKAQTWLEDQGDLKDVIAVKPSGDGPSHTRFAQKALESFLSTGILDASKVGRSESGDFETIQDAKTPVVDLTTGKLLTKSEDIRQALIRQFTKPIRLDKVEQSFQKQGVFSPLKVIATRVGDVVKRHPKETVAVVMGVGLAGVALAHYLPRPSRK